MRYIHSFKVARNPKVVGNGAAEAAPAQNPTGRAQAEGQSTCGYRNRDENRNVYWYIDLHFYSLHFYSSMSSVADEFRQ